MNSDYENKLLSPEDKEFVDRLASHYTPPSMTPAQRIAFDGALEERITRRARVSFLGPVAGVATACAALLMWFTVPYLGTLRPDGGTQPGTPVVVNDRASDLAHEENLLTYAYYNSEFYGDESEGEEEDLLPDEYEALATALALPGA